MRAATEKYINDLKKIEFPRYVKEIILFGSEAYGSPNLYSDIDIAVVYEGKYSIKLRGDVEELFEQVISPYDLQLVFVNKSRERLNFDVRDCIFGRGIKIYEE